MALELQPDGIRMLCEVVAVGKTHHAIFVPRLQEPFLIPVDSVPPEWDGRRLTRGRHFFANVIVGERGHAQILNFRSYGVESQEDR